MSVHVTLPILKLNLVGPAKAVLLVFGDHANPAGENSFPGLLTVAREAGYSLKTAKRYATAFRADKVLVVEENAGSGRRAVAYRIDLDRAAALYGVLAATAPDVAFSTPGDRTAANRAKEKGHSDPIPEEKKRVTESNKRVTESKEKGHCDPLTCKEPVRTGARAREGGPPPPGPGGGPGTAGPPEHWAAEPEPKPEAATTEPETKPEDPPPACTHWRNHESAIADYLGGAWESWFKELVVLSDDGALIRLGGRSKFWAEHCQKLTPGLEAMLGRKLEVVFWDPSAKAAARRARETEEKREAMLNEQA